MNTHDVIQSQYLAALAMLQEVIDKCPDAMWQNTPDREQFWHVAYHVLFYVHLYLQPTEADFTPWRLHRDEGRSLDKTVVRPYTKAEVLEYLDLCRAEVAKQVPQLDLDAPSGFYWLPFNKLALQFYNIRHLQHHTGELSDRLGRLDIDLEWVGMG